MNGISHNQAIKWIHRRMDGMLKGNQFSKLEEHLHSCDSCRAYAEEMDLLSARLNLEFQSHWDANSGPSPDVMKRVTADARDIPMANRFSANLRLLGGIAALVVLGFVINFFVSQLQSSSPSTNAMGTADISLLPENRLLAFASNQNGNFDIYTMHADGSGLTNITNHPASDYRPFWSPDGKRIAFASDRDGSSQLYFMNADGSNLIQLTEDEGYNGFDPNGNNPWSPDGTKLIFSHASPGEQNSRLYIMNIADKSTTTLTNEPGNYFLPSWSPNGEHIALVSNNPHNPEVLQMIIIDPDGDNLTTVTRLLQKNERLDGFQYDWSPDGRSIFFTAYRHTNEGGDQWIAYEADLDNNRLIETAASSTPMSSWWEGTAFITGFDLSTLTWMRQDGTYSTLNALEHCDMAANAQIGFLAKRSSIGDLLISVSCPNDDLWLYWAAADGSSIKQLLDSPLSEEGFELSGLVWSPENEFIALNISSPNMTDMYILNVSEALSDPSIQPFRVTLGGGSMFYGSPSWQPNP